MGILERIRSSVPAPSGEAQPISVTGRGHTSGFLNLEELNVELQGRAGLEIYDRMFRTDGDVRQVLHLLANPIAAGTWEVEPAGGSKADADAVADAEFIRWALFENMTPSLRGHLFEALPVLFRSGFAPFEKVHEVTEYEGEKVTVIHSLQLRLPRTIYRWKQDKWGGLMAIEQYLPVPRGQVLAGPDEVDTADGDFEQTKWLPAQNLIYYRIGAEGDNWEGVSLLRPAYKHWLFKDAIERMDAVAQEKEALGTPVCYPPMSATPEQLDAMESILAGLRTNAQGYVLMPGPKAVTSAGTGQTFGQGWVLEYLAPGHHGTGRDPQPSLRYHTDKIAAAFIAEFIRVGHSLTGGSRNVAETQADPFLVGVEAVAGLVEDIIAEQLVAPLIAYNRPKAKALPRVKMSLVDATTLSQLADFILKLVQVGALLPDQTLEDFLRSRADLPPADPDAVDERGDLDDSLRREILMGKNGGGGAPAGTNGPAGSETGGDAGGSKGVDNKDKSPAPAPSAPAPPQSAHEALTRRALLDAGSEGRRRWRDPTKYELDVDLDAIEDHLDAMPDRMSAECGGHMLSMARHLASRPHQARSQHPALQSAITHALEHSYEFGQATAGAEMERKMHGGLQLAAAARGSMGDRAALGAEHVLDSMYHAVKHAALAGRDEAARQTAAERAGKAALRQVGQTHSMAAFNQGREDRILDAGGKWGYVYTSILDKNTCDECRAADDEVVRAPDDPVRLANKPPNPHCDSALSLRGNMCRCFEIPERMD